MIPWRRSRIVIKVSVCALLHCCVLGCSSQHLLSDALLERLRGQGPVAVEADNPFSAANLWLSEEAERSQEMRGFLALKGQPRAIEINREFLSAPRATFFYLEQSGEVQYSLEPIASTWIIKGPETGDPTLAAHFNPKASAALSSSPVKIEPLTIRSNHHAPRGGNFVSPAVDTHRARVSFTALEGSRLSESLQDIIARTAEGSAELSPKGDLVHYVTFPGEHLSLIARWYTLDVNNASRLTRINQLQVPDSLEIGDQIIIPSYMVKNKARLTEHGLQALLP